jgi:hypothetical protein
MKPKFMPDASVADMWAEFATGGWQRYRTVEVGRVELPMGAHRAILRALSKPGEAVVNVRALRLVREK